MIKKFETMQELPRFDTETQREQMLLEKMRPIDLLDTELQQTF